MNNLCHQEDSEFNANKNKSFSDKKMLDKSKQNNFF